MDITSILIAIIGALAGGGLVSLLTIRETKKSMKIDNKAKEDDRWSKLADELKDQNETLNERIDKKDARIIELEDRNATLREQLDKSRSKCIAAELIKCVKLECTDRVPKIGTKYLDVDQIVKQSEE